MHIQALKEIKLYLKHDLAKVEDIIANALKSELSVINDVVSHLSNFSGKRIRPIFSIASAKLCDLLPDADSINNLAAAIELIHNATLLHDDVVDNNNIRRGVYNTKKIWGNQMSVLVGDLLLSVAFKLLAKCDSIDAISAVSDVAFLLSEGEIRQLVNTGVIISEEEYIKTISLKTASLFAISCNIVAVIAKEENLKKILYDFGINLGIAFQVIDDLLDYDNSSFIGKTIGNDFYNSKVTLPVILAYNLADEEERVFWERSFCSTDEKNLKEAVHYLKRNDIFNKCASRAKVYVNNCLDLLENFVDSEIKHLLKRALEFTLMRDF